MAKISFDRPLEVKDDKAASILIKAAKGSRKCRDPVSPAREYLDAVNDLSVIPVHIFGGLTPRQVRALVLAFENGSLPPPEHSHPSSSSGRARTKTAYRNSETAGVRR